MDAIDVALNAIKNKELLDDSITKLMWIDSLEQEIKEYAEMKCAEQREIIAVELPDRCFVDIDESTITSMPKPNFD